jgi:YcaO-like protein with predicted kinase domain
MLDSAMTDSPLTIAGSAWRRDAETFKCAPVSHTIARIQAGFARLGLKIGETSGTLGGNRELSWLRARCDELDMEASGKGVSPALARASAFAELAERFSAGLYFRSLRFRQALPEATRVAGYDAFCQGAYLTGYRRGTAAEVKQAIPLTWLVAPKTADAASERLLAADALSQHWVSGWSLSRKAAVRLPWPLIERVSGTNGLASGNTLEEATIQGICEVLERFAAVSAIIEQPELPTIDPDSLPDDPAVAAFLRYCADRGIDWQIKDFSLGLGLPCIGLMMTDPRMKDAGNPLKTAYAYQRFRVAASPRPREALIRCLTEESQSRWRVFAADASNPYDILWHQLFKHLPEESGRPNPLYPLLRSYEYPGELSFMVQGPVVSFPPAAPDRDCGAEIAELERCIARLGSELMIVDLTHPILQFPTVRVVAPGVSNILCRLEREPGLDMERLTAISDDFCAAGQDFYLADGWLNDSAAGQDLAGLLVDHMRQHHSLKLHTTGLPRRPLRIPELLVPLLLRLRHLPGVAGCCETLALMHPEQARRYRHLAALARAGDGDALQAELRDPGPPGVLRALTAAVANPLRGVEDPAAAARIADLIASFYRS